MAKGYWIVHVDVAEPEAFKRYQAAAVLHFAKFDARILAAGGANRVVEGQARAAHVIVEFKDYATAQACWDSAEYADVRSLRRGIATLDAILVEGLDGAPPA